MFHKILLKPHFFLLKVKKITIVNIKDISILSISDYNLIIR